MLTVSTWNVNSIRQRLGLLVDWLAKDQIDVVLLQELKCTKDQFPYSELEELGYNIVVNGQKAYNGVAILSKMPIEDCVMVLPGDDEDEQARYIECVVSVSGLAIRVSSIYVPNGREIHSLSFKYKMNFYERMYRHFDSLLKYEELMVLGGDYNVAPEEIDVYDPEKLDGRIGFHLEERGKFRQLLNLGLYDAFRALNSDKKEFSWWDYRSKGWKCNRGMRIDNILLSPQALDKATSCSILSPMRDLEKPSDHAPVSVNLTI